MKKSIIVAATVVATGLAGLIVTGALAESSVEKSDRTEMRAVLAAKVSLGEAVKAAEASGAGKVAEVKFGTEKGVAGYEMTLIAADGTEHSVLVDATSGAVTAVTGDEDDQDGEGEDG